MSTNNQEKSPRPIAAAIGFAGSIIALGLSANSSELATFAMSVSLFGVVIFGTLLVREIVGSIHPAKIIAYLAPE